MPKILVTGFEPFGHSATNSSWQAVQLLPAESAEFEIVSAELSCVFGESTNELRDLIAKHNPDVIICVGQADSREKVSLERIAINIDDARIPDNAGNQPIDSAIIVDGPAAYWTGLPIKSCLVALNAEKIPAEISQTAGTYVCNHIFYNLMHEVKNNPQIKAGFVHVPLTDKISAEDLARAILKIISVSVANDVDIQISGGAEE